MRKQGNLQKMSDKEYEAAMAPLQVGLVELQEWVKQQGLRVVVLFEGRAPPVRAGSSNASPRA